MFNISEQHYYDLMSNLSVKDAIESESDALCSVRILIKSLSDSAIVCLVQPYNFKLILGTKNSRDLH